MPNLTATSNLACLSFSEEERGAADTSGEKEGRLGEGLGGEEKLIRLEKSN